MVLSDWIATKWLLPVVMNKTFVKICTWVGFLTQQSVPQSYCAACDGLTLCIDPPQALDGIVGLERMYVITESGRWRNPLQRTDEFCIK